MKAKDQAKELVEKFTTKEDALNAIDLLKEFIVKYDNHLEDFLFWEKVEKKIKKSC
jgi:hypothetical protein